MSPVHPRDVEELRQRLEPWAAYLYQSRPADRGQDEERAALLASWERWREQPAGWLEAPERLREGRALELRFARAQAEPRFVTGSKWLRVVTPHDANDYKADVDAQVQGTEADVTASSTLDEATRNAWELWRAAWGKFMADKAGWFNAAAQMDHAEDARDELHDWQTRLREHGLTLTAPVVTKVDRPELDTGLIKTGLVVAGIVGAAMLVRSIAGR
jgi:hypothetical protein